jgi:hypothetical protein
MPYLGIMQLFDPGGRLIMRDEYFFLDGHAGKEIRLPQETTGIYFLTFYNREGHRSLPLVIMP